MDQAFFESLGKELAGAAGGWTQAVDFAVLKVAEIRADQAVKRGEIMPHEHWQVSRTLVQWAHNAARDTGVAYP